MQDFSLAIATPSHYGNFCAEYVRSVFDLQQYCRENEIATKLLLTTGISVVDHARNLLANRFLSETDCSHMLFIDDDMGFNAEELGTMFEWRDRDVVAALYPKKTFDWKRIKEAVLAHPDIPPESLPHIGGDYLEMFMMPDEAPTMTIGRDPIRILVAATGLMMISRQCLLDLIEKAKLPSIRLTGPQAPNYPVYEFFRCSSANNEPQGEDYYFCSLVNQYGGSVYGCPWVPVTHTGKYAYIGDLPGIARYS